MACKASSDVAVTASSPTSIIMLFPFLVAALFTGCSTQTIDQRTLFNTEFAAGNFANAYKLSGLASDETSLEADVDLNWVLQAASAARESGDYATSNRLFDQTEVLFKGFDTENEVVSGLWDSTTSSLLNDTYMDYKGNVYDAILVNSYKSMNFLQLDNWTYARIELNRAMDRQRRAREFFSEMIAEQKKELKAEQESTQAEQKKNKEKGKSSTSAIDFDRSEKAATKGLSDVYSNMEKWEVYADFINPWASYLHGLFLFLNAEDPSDFTKAADSLKEARGMAPDNVFVKADFERLVKISSGERSEAEVPPTVWVIFENGLGPVKISRQVDIPLFLLGNKQSLLLATMAFPELQTRPSAYGSLTIKTASQVVQTETVASVDRIVQTEFKKEFPVLVRRQMMSTLVKGYVQYEAGRQLGTAGLLGAALLQQYLAVADTRIWSALPKEYQIAQVKRPLNGTVTLVAPDGLSWEVPVPETKHAVIIARIPTAGVTPTFHTMGFGMSLSDPKT